MASPFGGLLTDPEAAFRYTMQKAKGAGRYAGWALPAAVGGGWLIWPAISDAFKVDLGLLPDPEKAAAQAEAASKLNAPIVLSGSAAKAVANAHHPAQADINPHFSASVKSGDFSAYHATWDKHFVETLKVRDDDDDDDEDDEDEDEDEEE
uniref:Uncharacterized protein n=1 Tax=Leptocylindrus danicus TaxID=163516 RepID=A0A6U2MM01_9STRA|mmetsp:Transcript_17932/g.26695  ORF Transcript_17932/g.26695 Transcript_17932/m.26695 type:complete len:151 (+) Transcript_17932:76-528(+)|eukprot:CAMPEP_0116029332 /NCGR_PEP_ID=MMETSP0321-20121206/16080_1 /TAXON_ID=163516 /ORGANISM="Leptocylindrus danicus var. danicus, Strain B650" /LENGTH=150 /DNA_ID=CAMNT_0003503695 /DNA_START=28 /DNA_END=480 /DNA_ORIENTATION=+